MPSLLPELFNFSFVSPFVLRIALGIPLIKHGFKKIIDGEKISHKIFGGIIFLSGILLIVGLFTQAAAITVSLIIIANSIILRKRNPHSLTERLVKLAISVSLILTGPGIFAFDLPL